MPLPRRHPLPAGREQRAAGPLGEAAAARAHAADIEAALNPAELGEWHTAVTQAEAEGTFFIALPFHCAAGTKG